MPLVELKVNEHFILEIIRQFDFLREFDYKITDIGLYGREYGIIYLSYPAKRKIILAWEYHNFLLDIENHRGLIPKVIFYRKLCSYFNAGYLDVKVDETNYCEVIKMNANFAKEKLMPIIKGLEWIKSIEQRK